MTSTTFASAIFNQSTLNMNTTKYWITAMVCVALGITSCSKDKNEVTAPVTADSSIYNKLIVVKNFTGDTSSLTAPDADRSTIYFSLEQQKPAPAEYVLTNRWDMSFSGVYNTSIGGNFGNDNSSGSSLGKGGPGLGGVLILSQSFDQVTKVPDNAVFSTQAAPFGLDDAGSFGNGVGWAVYDWSGDLKAKLGFGGSSPEQAHTCWARPDRTILVRTATGNYAKVQIISLYKDAPAEPVTHSLSPYFNFQYVIAKPGTKDFTIK